MNWQIAVILTGLLSGLSQVVGKRQVDRMGAFQSGVLRDVTSLVMVIGVCIWQGGVAVQWQGALIFFVGLMESVSIAAYFSAQREHMTATAVFSYPFSQLLIIGMAGVFFQEWKYFDVRQIQGMFNVLALGLTIALMFIYQGGGEKKKRTPFRWSWMLVMSAVVIALSNIESKWSVSNLGYSPAVSMLYEFGGIVTGGLLYVALRKQGMKVGWTSLAWGIIQGLLFGGSALWYYALLKNSPLGIASVVRRVTIVLVTVLAGVFGYKEGKKMNQRQWIAVALGLVIFALVMTVNK